MRWFSRSKYACCTFSRSRAVSSTRPAALQCRHVVRSASTETFLRAHGLQRDNQPPVLAKNRFLQPLQFFFAVARLGHQHAGQTEDRIQVGVGGEAMFGGGGAKRLNIRGHQRVIVPGLGFLAAFQIQRHFHMTAVQFLFQHAAQLEFDPFRSLRQPHMQIEEAVVHAFQAEENPSVSETRPAIRANPVIEYTGCFASLIGWSSPAAPARSLRPRNLSPLPVPFPLFSPISINCNRYSF